MLNEHEPKTASIPPFALRMQPRLRKRLQKEADKNRRSLNSEIVAILEEHFKMEPSRAEPGAIMGAQTDAATKLWALENRLEWVEKAVSALCRNEALFDGLPDVARKELQGALIAIRDD